MDDRHHTAIHEAGHAVALARFGRDQGSVSIVPEAGTLGRAFGEGLNNIWSAHDAREIAITDAAGYAAMVVHGLSEAEAIAGAWDDFDNIEVAIRDWMPETTVEQVKAQAVELMREPANVLAVRLVAEELLRRSLVDAQHLWVLIDLADGECTEEEYREFLALAGLD